MKMTFLITSILLFCSCAISGGDAQEIRELRAENNQAIANEDLDGIGAAFQSNIQVTISSGGHLDGAETYLGAFASVFGSVPGINFVRTPHQIKVSEDGTVASEEGTWVGTYPNQNVTETTGTYMACWRKNADGAWLISAELYVPLRAQP